MTESRELPCGGRHIAVAGLVIIAFIIRVHGLDAQSIWWDEAISIHLARSSVGEIVSNRAANLHPLLYLYLFLLRLWRVLAGDSAFRVRFLSVWLGVPLIPGLYVFGRRWLTRRGHSKGSPVLRAYHAGDKAWRREGVVDSLREQKMGSVW